MLLSFAAVPVVAAVSESVISAVEDGSVVLTFTISMDSPPVATEDITWIHQTVDGSFSDITNSSSQRFTFSPDRLSLTISELMKSDEGIYTLTAANQAGSNSSFIVLNIEGMDEGSV